MNFEEGFVKCTKDEYLADPCPEPSLSSSIAHLLVTRSPAHAWSAHPKGAGHRKDPTAAMLKGTLVDSLLLGGDSEVIESPYAEYRTNEAKAWKQAALDQGKLPVKTNELNDARRAVDAICEALEKEKIQLTGEHQATGLWRDGDVWARFRLDHWKREEALIYDLKLTENAHPDAVAHKMFEYGYDIQAASYTRGVEHLIPELIGRVRFVFIFAESEPPHNVLIARPDGAMRALGLSRWESAVRQWEKCLKAKSWPGYPSGEVQIAPPPWALAKMDVVSTEVPF